jgi:hypothetical protein
MVRLAGIGLGVLLVIGLAALGFWLATALKAQPPAADSSEPVQAKAPFVWQRPVVSEDELVDKVGVRLMQVAATGGGGLIDLRFQVIDPEKAFAVHDESSPPVIIDEASGLVVDQLLMGHNHSGPYQPGVTYYLVFENPGNLVQPGSQVSVLLGNVEVDHVTVR